MDLDTVQSLLTASVKVDNDDSTVDLQKLRNKALTVMLIANPVQKTTIRRIIQLFTKEQLESRMAGTP